MKTVVLGAGMAGLTVARELARQNREVVVIEPRLRAGGRVLTRHSHVHGFAVDLGPEFIHGDPPETRALVAHPHRDIASLKERQRTYWRGQINAEVADEVQTLAEALSERAPDAPVAKAIDELGLDPLRYATLLSFVEGFNAADASLLSTNALLEEGRRSKDDLLAVSRLLPGYASLADVLVKSCEDLGVELRFGETAREIRWSPGEAWVRIAREDGEYEERASAVVTTLPVSCFADLKFTPELPQHRAAAERIAMGDVQKIVFTFKHALWERPKDIDIDFLHSPELTFAVSWAWGWVKPFTLTAWSAGRRAVRLRGRGDDAVTRAALADLSETLKIDTQVLAREVDEIFYHDWMTDPHSRGAYSYVLVGGESARRDFARPVSGTLFFAGEATDNAGAAGTVQGAIRSGLRVAVELRDT